MALRTRLALTFVFLLAVVLAAALGAVWVVSHAGAKLEAHRQLNAGALIFSRVIEDDRRVLTQAAQAVASEYAFREAVATNDTATIVSALENSGSRVDATIMILTSLDGRVIASSGGHLAIGSHFPIEPLRRHAPAREGLASVIVDNDRILQLVAVQVRSPLPVAWIVMGFDLDKKTAAELADITGLHVTLSVKTSGVWKQVAGAAPAGSSTTSADSGATPGDSSRRGDMVTLPIPLASLDETQVEATLSRSLAEAYAPFDRMTEILFAIAGLSLVGFAWAAGFWIARNITRPLQDLTQSVDRMRGGTYDVALTIGRHDEIGVLAEGLQRMQSAVSTRDQSIRRLAYEDALTGLMNRTAFGATLQQALKDADGAPLGVAVIDLNRFKRINEHLGYSVGDAVLKEIAARLAAVPSIAAALARLTANQFAAFTRLRDPADLHGWGTSLLIALAEPVLVESQPVDISATLGLALAGADGAAEDVLRRADLALEHARREKRAMALYKDEFKPAARDQLSLLGELRLAVERDELQLFFQPKIDLASGRVAGAEVLLRWQHPTRGLLSPAAFVPFAEQTGFIRRITRWALDHAIAQGAAWQQAGTPLPLAVNIAADDLDDARFDSRVAGLLTRHQLSPSLLTLELTESGFIADPERALRMLDALSALGLNLSIDDFGTGYSSLSHLARMPVHEMKIDRSFVHGLETDAEYDAIVKSAIDMGHSMGLQVVAEGIENESAAKRLLELGCDIAQGFLYARPMPLADLTAWLEHRSRMPVIALPIDFSAEDIVDTVVLSAY
jgi:diguanylate cyclase (GGDEF)-like protein